MSLIVTIVEAFAAGLMLFLLFPAFLRLLDWDQKKGILNQYGNLAMSILGRGILLKRSHGGITLLKTDFDARIGAETAKIGGQKKHWRDPKNYMTTLYGEPFGVAHEKRNLIINPRVAHLGRLFKEAKQNGEWEVNGHRKAYFPISEGRHLVQLDDALPIIQGSATPGIADRVEVFVEKGQSMFDRSQMLEMMPWLIGLGAGVGLCWLIAKLASTTANTSVVAI